MLQHARVNNHVMQIDFAAAIQDLSKPEPISTLMGLQVLFTAVS